MKKISSDIMEFFEKEEVVIVSTINARGMIHCSVKGIVGIEGRGKIYLIDIYKKNTFRNLKRDPRISITAVDSHRFIGYTLNGKAKIVNKDSIKEHIVKRWEDRIVKRISDRVVRNITSGRKLTSHPEAHFPHPQYLIEMDVTGITDLAPGPIRKKYRF